MTSTAQKSALPAVRERLLDAADRLFYQEGIRAVGIDRVLEEAGAAKASLYSHFGCKDDLVAAYLHRRVLSARASMNAFVSGIPEAERAYRIFDWILAWAETSEFRGCPMQHVVNELPDPSHQARIIASDQRQYMLSQFTTWSIAAGASDVDRTAGALMVLFDGAIAASEQDGPQRARDARWLAERLMYGK